MLRKAVLLSVGVAFCGLASGCGSGTTAAEIAESYGILNRGNLQPKIAGIIQSGQADAMIDQGIAKVRHRVNGLGKNRVLVTEYLIQGEVYRIEVRRAIDPTRNIPTDRIQYATSQQGPNKQVITWFHLANIWSTLRDNSYEAQPVVAYRSWRGLDGKVRNTIVQPGPEPKWETHDEDMNLCVRTKVWPIVEMWVRGMTVDARQATSGAGRNEMACDGRWILESAGSGVEGQPTNVGGQTYFINLKLAKAIGS
jgi:hypothetical protein